MSESAPGGAWSVAFRQWRGERPYQEDDFGIVGGTFGGDGTPPELLMVLADGMGGEVGGARASRSVVRTFLGRFGEIEGPTDARLNECLDEANRGLHDQVAFDPDLDGMGSTVVAAVYDGRNVSWLSVGDSPMWLFAEGRLTRLNADHSMAPVLDGMVERGEMSRQEALTDGTRHMLRSAVTGLEVDYVDCDRHPCRLGQGDYLLVASDGIETLTEEDIEHCLDTTDGNAEAAADALYSAVQAADRPNQDNVTFLLLAGREHGAHPAGSERTMPALVPPSAPVTRTRAPSTPLIPRGGGRRTAGGGRPDAGHRTDMVVPGPFVPDGVGGRAPAGDDDRGARTGRGRLAGTAGGARRDGGSGAGGHRRFGGTATTAGSRDRRPGGRRTGGTTGAACRFRHAAAAGRAVEGTRAGSCRRRRHGGDRLTGIGDGVAAARPRIRETGRPRHLPRPRRFHPGTTAQGTRSRRCGGACGPPGRADGAAAGAGRPLRTSRHGNLRRNHSRPVGGARVVGPAGARAGDGVDAR